MIGVFWRTGLRYDWSLLGLGLSPGNSNVLRCFYFEDVVTIEVANSWGDHVFSSWAFKGCVYDYICMYIEITISNMIIFELCRCETFRLYFIMN